MKILKEKIFDQLLYAYSNIFSLRIFIYAHVDQLLYACSNIFSLRIFIYAHVDQLLYAYSNIFSLRIFICAHVDQLLRAREMYDYIFSLINKEKIHSYMRA